MKKSGVRLARRKKKQKISKSESEKSIYLRTLSTLVLGPVLLGIAVLPARWPILTLAVICFLLALMEFYDLMEKAGNKPYRWLGVSSGAGMLILLACPQSPEAALVGWGTLSVAAILSFPLYKGRRNLGAVRAGATLIGLLYVVGFSGFFVVWAGLAQGRVMIPSLLVLCWVFDSAAMGVGKAWGKHRLSKASPNKTWEGAAGGLAGILVIVFVFRRFVGLWNTFSGIECLGACLILGAAAVLGDLVASSLKREAGVSDSGSITILPGHGGILDKLDSLLFVVPSLWFYFAWVE